MDIEIVQKLERKVKGFISDFSEARAKELKDAD